MAVIRENGIVKLEVTPISKPKLIGRRTTYSFGEFMAVYKIHEWYSSKNVKVMKEKKNLSQIEDT